MSGVSAAERRALHRSVEHNGKLANERFGYMYALEITLSKFLSKDDVKLAVDAAKNRDFVEFEKITRGVMPN